MADHDALTSLLHLRKGTGSRVGAERIRLLEAIGKQGSIAGAAKALDLSYKGAWDAVQALNNLFERSLVEAQSGGRAGGVAEVTPAGRAVIAAFRRIEDELAATIGRLEQDLAVGRLDELIGSLSMKTSARNLLRGVVAHITDGAVNAEVALTIAPGVEIVAVITRESVHDLGLAPGVAALALIKSSFVILAPGGQALRTSARNQLTGVIVRHEAGAVNDEVVLDLGEGKTLTATITSVSWRELGLAVGDTALALVKASHVILAVD